MHQLAIGAGGSGVSAAESLKIVQSEIDNLNLITDIIKTEQLDVDFWRGQLCEGTPVRVVSFNTADPGLSPRNQDFVRGTCRRLPGVDRGEEGARDTGGTRDDVDHGSGTGEKGSSGAGRILLRSPDPLSRSQDSTTPTHASSAPPALSTRTSLSQTPLHSR